MEMNMSPTVKVNFQFSTSITKIEAGVENEKMINGFTRYFRKYKAQVEKNAKEARNYIFVFSAKEYEKKRDSILKAKNKIIIIDNTDVTLASDIELFNSGDFLNIVENNQLIIKDFHANGDKSFIRNNIPNDTATLIETSEKKNGKVYKEIRLRYDNRRNYHHPVVLYLDKGSVAYAGLEIVKMDEYKDAIAEKEELYKLIKILEDTKVLDVTNWTSEDMEFLIDEMEDSLGSIFLYSESKNISEYIDKVHLEVHDSEQFSGTKGLKRYDNLAVGQLIQKLSVRARHVEFLGELYYKGKPLKDGEVYLWESKEPGLEDKQYVTFVLFPNLEYITYELNELGNKGDKRYSYRLSFEKGFSGKDAITLVTPINDKLLTEQMVRVITS